MNRFYLGTHRLNWLELTEVPLFVSVTHMWKRKELPRARGPWGQDSSGFTQLGKHGQWTFTPSKYASMTVRASEEIGRMDLAAIMDWMCEAKVLAKTGKTIAEHQALTIRSYLDLCELAPGIPWLPVLQGWECDDYLDHIEQYNQHGIDLRLNPAVGVGSICRRQGTREAARIIRSVAMQGIRIHAFGVKTDGLRMFGDWVESADSTAWSYGARRRKLLMPQCIGGSHKNCANCIHYALDWRATKIPQEIHALPAVA